MSDYKRGDIWLANAAKHTVGGQEHKRPVLIISNNKYNDSSNEVICLHITTDTKHEYGIPLDYKKDFEMNKLVDPSAVRFDAVGRYSISIFEKKLGKVKEEKILKIIESLNSLLRES